MLTDYPINRRVQVKITGTLPSGLLGHVMGGPKAIVRTREISWSQPLPLREYVGQTRDAIVIGYNPVYRELEVSLRLAQRDPWCDVGKNYPPGAVVQGRVVGLIENAAFVELEPGVVALLPGSELPVEPASRIEDWLWIEDHVCALVADVDPSRRRMRLSLRALLARREAQFRRRIWALNQRADSEVTLGEVLPQGVRLRLLRIGRSPVRNAECSTLRVLVVEDDDTYAAGLECFLKRNGCEVFLAADGVAALEAVSTHKEPFHFILVDWNLPGLKGHEVIQRLRKQECTPYLAVVLEPAPLAERPEVLETLRDAGVDVFSKADGERLHTGLISIIQEIRQNGAHSHAPRPRFWPEDELRRPVVVHHSRAGSRRPPDALDTTKGILERLARETHATTVALVCLSPEEPRFRTECCIGQPFPVDEAPPDLIHSPLADILNEGREVSETVVPESARFKRLLALRQFQGFLGVPLPDLEAWPRGLILLKQTGCFGPRDRHQARLSASLVARTMQERRLIQSLQPWQAQNAAGQLVASAIHEITNKLGGVEKQVATLLEDLRTLAQHPEKAGDATFLRGMERAVEIIARAQQEASRLRDQYLRLTASDEPQRVELGALLQDVLSLLRPQAQANNILLDCALPRTLPPVLARPSHLSQILVNLLLNAIQQMAQSRREGCVTVEASYAPGAFLPVRIRVRDEGPGIHVRHWERIFDFGFTTRKPRGAGLGLTISKQIAAELGGNLRVEESHMLWGTTFLLELPGGE